MRDGTKIEGSQKKRSSQIKKMFMIKLTGFGNIKIRNGECSWSGMQRTWRAWRRGSSGKLPNKKSNQTATKNEVECPHDSLAKGPDRKEESRQEQTYRDLGSQTGMTAGSGS